MRLSSVDYKEECFIFLDKYIVEGMMRKNRNLKLDRSLAILFLVLFFVGMNLVQAQMKAQGKPSDKGKPPSPPSCNNNAICEDGEYDYSKLFEEQTCPDCAPKNYSPLDTVSSPFFLGVDGWWASRIFQFKYIDGNYIDVWASKEFLGSRIDYDYGDYNSDGVMDILAVNLTSSTEGKGKKQITYTTHTLIGFEQGSDGTPSFESPFFGPSTEILSKFKLADADNDGFENELIFKSEDIIRIFRWDGDQFVNVWTSLPYGDPIFRFDVGDADGDGRNEIVCAMFSGSYALVIDSLGDDLWGNETATEIITVGNPDVSFIAIDQALPCDADNDGISREIIAGGNNNRLMVWALVNGAYKTVAMSDDLGHFTQGIGCGDFNGDGENEIIAGAYTGTLHTFKLRCTNPDPENPQYTLEFLQSSTTEHEVFEFWTGDVDADGRDELLSRWGVIYDDLGSGLQPDFNSFYLRNPRIK